MNVDFTRPSLFRAMLYFLLLYILFRYRGWGVELVLPPDGGMMPLEKWMTSFFTGHPLWKEVYQLVISLFSIFSLSRILSRNMIYLERTFVPALIFPLVAWGYASSAVTPVTLTVAFLLVFTVANMINAYKREGNSSFFLHAAIALGFAPLIYAPAVVFILLLPIGFILFRQNWRSVITASLCYFVPLALCSYILWGMGENFGNTTRQIVSIITAPTSETLFIFRMDVWDYILAGVFLLLTLFGISHFFSGQTQIRRRSLRGFTIFVWILVLSCGMLALPCRSLDMLPILAVPLSAIIPACFNRKSGWWPNLLYLLMLWSVIIYNVLQIFPNWLP